MRFLLKLALAVLPLLAGTLHAAFDSTRVLFLDDFESYTNTAALRSTWISGTATLETNAPGGGHAALHDGGTMNDFSSLSARPDARFNVRFSADFFDPATNDEKRVTIILKNASGQSIEFGFVPKINSYAVRVLGFTTPTDWIPFDANYCSIPGWHRFQATISLTNTLVTLDLRRNGILDKAFTFDGPAPEKPFKTIRFGGLADRRSPGGPMLVDNVELALVPANNPLPVIAMHPPALAPVPAPNYANERPPTPPVQPGPPRAPRPIIIAPSPEPDSNPALWWIVGALAVIIGLLGALLLTLRRGRAGQNSWAVATVPPPGVIPGQAPGHNAQLTEFAKQSLVQGLYTQRQALLEAQQQARQELTELEKRLSTLQVPLQDRIHTYEKRIAELEKQLESRGAEMQELTQVTLRLVREKLEEEKERQRTGTGIRLN